MLEKVRKYVVVVVDRFFREQSRRFDCIGKRCVNNRWCGGVTIYHCGILRQRILFVIVFVITLAFVLIVIVAVVANAVVAV